MVWGLVRGSQEGRKDARAKEAIDAKFDGSLVRRRRVGGGDERGANDFRAVPAVADLGDELFLGDERRVVDDDGERREEGDGGRANSRV